MSRLPAVCHDKFRQPACYSKRNVENDKIHAMAGNARLQSDRGLSEISPLSFISDGCPDCVPFAGNRNNTDLNNEGNNGYYWSGTQNNDNNAYNLNCNWDNGNWNNNWNRENGLSVRPVSEFMDKSSSSPFQTSPEQLLLDLYKAYKDARRHKRKKPYVMRFDSNLEDELISLRDELLSRTYTPRPCSCFIISDPKVREIFAADFRDRIVHHLYYNYTHTLFERTFIADSYSCIKGRGTHYGIRRLEHHIRSISLNHTRRTYVLKMDIKGYFMNIDRKILLEICLNTFDRMQKHKSDEADKTWGEKLDYPFIRYLSEVIIMNDPVKGCLRIGKTSDWKILPNSKSLFHSPKGCGLPIGNLTSQLFSNVYMNEYDQFMKRVLKCKASGRYVDDSFVVGNHKEELRSTAKTATIFLKQRLKLEAHPDKMTICHTAHGVGFLGAYLKPYRRYIHIKSLQHISDGVDSLISCPFRSPSTIQSSLNSYLGTLSHYYSYRLRCNIIKNHPELFKYGYFGKSLLKFHLRDSSTRSAREVIDEVAEANAEE